MAVNIVTFDFSYDVPDEYLHQTSNLNLKGTISYTGPDAIYVFVNKETGKIEIGRGWEAVDGTGKDFEMAKLRAGEGHEVVKLAAEDEPVLAWRLVPQDLDRDAMPQKEYKLDGDDTIYYSRTDPILPDHAYEIEDITYNLNVDKWNKPFPWKQPHMSWDRLNEVIDMIVASAEEDKANASADDAAKIDSYITEMKNISTKFAGWDAWQVPFPPHPLAPLPNEE